MDPQVPNTSSIPAPTNYPDTPELSKKDNHWVTILATALFVLLSLGVVAFLYYQNQQLKTLLTSYQSTPTPSASPDTTLSDWKIYTNPIEKFSFRYPSSWRIDTSGENGDQNKQNIIIKLTNGDAQIQFYADMVGIGGVGQNYQGTPFTINGVSLFKYKMTGADNKTIIIGITDELTQSLGLFRFSGKTYGFSLNYPTILDKTQEGTGLEKDFDQILSTFKFSGASASPSATPMACTQEAKLCPDGSYVGRTGPNCEFAPCPTP